MWHKDSVQKDVRPLPNIKQRKQLEANFVNDAVRTQIHCYPRKLPIIPKYSAASDKCARSYFNSPLVKQLMKTSIEVSTQRKQFCQFCHFLSKGQLLKERICFSGSKFLTLRVDPKELLYPEKQTGIHAS